MPASSTDDQNPSLELAALKRAECKRIKMGRKPKLSPQQVAPARKLIEGGESPAHNNHLVAYAESSEAEAQMAE
jgi:hypothetical protein